MSQIYKAPLAVLQAANLQAGEFGLATDGGGEVLLGIGGTGAQAVQLGAAGAVPSLGGISDVNLAGLADGQVIVWNAGAGEWQPGAGGGGAATLGALTDVDLGTDKALVDGDFFRYDAGQSRWENFLAGLDDLSDVTITAAATGEVLRYNGAAWVDATLAVGDLGDVDLTGLADGMALVYNTASTNWEATATLKTNISLAYAAGSILYADGTEFVDLAAGAEGETLVAHGAAAPTWETPTTGVYVHSFAATTTGATDGNGSSTDWADASPNAVLSITLASHGKDMAKTLPLKVYQISGTSRVEVSVDLFSVNTATGLVTVRVPIGSVFAGIVVIGEE